MGVINIGKRTGMIKTAATDEISAARENSGV
jgi:hypothetical protein